MFVYNGFGVFKLIGGPKYLYDLPVDELNGSYVEAEIFYLPDWYAVTESRREGSPVKTVVSREYIIPVGDMEFMGVLMNKENLTYADQIMEESQAYLDGEISELNNYFTVKGTILPMPEDSLGFYHDTIGYEELDAETQAWFLPYYLKVDYLGRTQTALTWVTTGIGVVCLAIGLLMLIRALTGAYQKEIKKYCETSGEGEFATERLEAFYQSTQPVGGIRMNDRWVLFQQGAWTRLLDAQDLCWAYQRTTRHRTNGIPTGKTYGLILKTRKKRSFDLGMAEATVQQTLHEIGMRLPHVVLGYAKELEREYKNNPEAFVRQPVTTPPDPSVEQ